MPLPSTVRASLVLAASVVSVSTFAQDREGSVETRTEWYRAPRRVEPTPTAGAQSLTTFSAFIPANSDPEADGPHELAFLPDGSAVVIAHKDTDNLTFFDVNTRTVTHTVAVGDFPVQVAVTPNGQYALAPCVFANAVAVVDVATHALVATIPITGSQPYDVQVSPDSLWAVVGVINNAVSSQFSVLDLTTLAEVAVIPTTAQGVIGGYFTPEAGISGTFFTRFELSPNGTTIVLPDRANARVGIYDRATASLVTNLATAANPAGVDVSTDGTTAVVSHEFGVKTITEIDLSVPSVPTVTGSFVGANDFFDRLVRITPDKSHAIAAILNSVAFVDLTTGATAAVLSTGSVGDIEISHDGVYAFISNFNSSVIHINSRTIVKVLTLAPSVEAATSPVALRAVALNTRFKEDAHVYNINGAAGFVEGFALTGAVPEGDAPRSIAVSADGRLAVVGNDTSRNICVVDLVAGSVRSWVNTGERVLGVAISPDNLTAVVCNGDSDTVSIIDLGTDTVVKTLAVPTRPAEVRISPDSQKAYVTTIAGTDRLWFLQLAGAASSVITSFPAGQMGSANGYPYIGFSGMELSPDGSVLAVCISFDDQLLLVDTATNSEIVRMLVGDFPYRVAFKPDGTRAYVINSFGDSVSVVGMAGAGSSVVSTIPGIDFPSTVDVDATGSHVYVGNAGTSPGVRVIDTAANFIVATVSTAGNTIGDAQISSLEGVLFASAGTSTGGNLLRVSTAGPASTLVATTPLSGSPAYLGFSEPLRSAVLCQPVPDGLDAKRFDLTSTYCVAAPNSAGPGAHMGYAGFTSVSLNQLTLLVTGSPPGKPGFFYYGSMQTQIPLGDGFRCAGGTVARLQPATPADGSGGNSRVLDFTAFPANGGPTHILPASTWNVSYWHRDPLGPGGTGVNLADGLSVTFTP